MVRIIHRSKIYTKEYFLSCLVYGFMFGWGESLVIWMSQPFRVEAWEVIKLNITGGIIGGLSCLLAASIVYGIHKYLSKSEKFKRDIHQTSWVFASSMALFSIFQSICSFKDTKLLFKALLVIIIAVIVFVVAYQLSYRLLFRKKNAVRFSIEFIVVIFLLVYLFNHPGFSKHIPINQIYKPHILIFDTENISEDEVFIEKLFPQNLQMDLVFLNYTYASVKTKHNNPTDLLTVFSADSTYSLLDFLDYYQYHLGFFSVGVFPAEFPKEKFHLADDQNYSLITKLGLFKLYNRLLGFLNLRKFVNNIDGYSRENNRDLTKFTERITRFLTQNRDEFPFFLYIRYPQWDRIVNDEDKNISQSIINLFNYLKKYSILDNALIIFTSSTGTNLRRPSFICYKNIALANINDNPMISQRDFPLTIAETISGKTIKGYFCQDLMQTLSERNLEQRVILVFRDYLAKDQPAVFAACGSYEMELKENGSVALYDLQSNVFVDINTIQDKAIWQMRQVLMQPNNKTRIKW